LRKTERIRGKHHFPSQAMYAVFCVIYRYFALFRGMFLQ